MTQQKIKILHIIKSLGRGGAERLLAETMALHAERFTFDVVYFLPWKNQMVGELEQQGARVYLLAANATPAMLAQVPALIKLIRQNKYDVIHCHLPWAGIIGRMAGKVTGTPVIYTEHNNIFTYHSITRKLHTAFFGSFKKVISVSMDAEKALRLAVPGYTSIRTILNGVNTSKFDRTPLLNDRNREQLSIPLNAIVVATVAVFRKQKRLDRWLQIAKSLSATHPEMHFIMIGDGPLRQELEELVQAEGLQKVVHMTGLSEDPRPFMATTDIYLMSSDFEGLPVALLEAMSMACVPVVTAVGGIPLVVDHGKNGFVYNPENWQDAVAIINSISKNAETLNKLGMQARATVERDYSMTRMVKELEEVYTECMLLPVHI